MLQFLYKYSTFLSTLQMEGEITEIKILPADESLDHH